MQISQAITIHAPTEGVASTSKPAIISITPAICINTWTEKGSIEARPGCKYMSQLVSKSVNLSNPATMGTIPKVNRSTAHTDLTVSFELVICIVNCLVQKIFFLFEQPGNFLAVVIVSKIPLKTFLHFIKPLM